jgi:hypothetical protein
MQFHSIAANTEIEQEAEKQTGGSVVKKQGSYLYLDKPSLETPSIYR